MTTRQRCLPIRFLAGITVCWGLLPSPGRAQDYPPEQAVRHMQPAEGFDVQLVAAEPLVRKPVAIEFDDRGRPWVLQYLQYPNPAGLKRVHVDRYSRTTYDRVPEPPPRGPKGADRVTILENLGPDGRARTAKDFVNGLNLATGIAFGHGGVFILQAPYLLFYPDRNGDDVPDGDPEVLLAGFGMEDAHSVANSLTWGPDGWLYGCQGSTVTAKIRGLEFQQGVWRYHPLSHRFELFCEGGGNSWGLDFDRHGNLFYSTNVGGFVMLHGVQGGYYWKQFGKHGALHNPFAFGYFDHVPHRNFQGGHVTVGGIIYQGDSFPERFRGKYIAADLLGHHLYWHNVTPDGSSFRSSHGGALLLANDTAFAPSDVTAGPDGAVYVADWHDKRTAHPDPDAAWDRTKGRIYRIAARGTKPAKIPDFAKLSSAQLVGLLANPNDWLVRKARRVLADRRDPEVIFPLRTFITETKNDDLALQALWALYVSGGFDEDFARRLLDHRNPDVRRWTVRLLGDENRVSAAVARRLVELAGSEPDVTVRSQLACTARRLPAPDGLPIVERLVLRNLDGHDPHLPLLLWWAVERHALDAPEMVLATCTSTTAWKTSVGREVILPRLMRRYAAAGTEAAYTACARLLASAPSSAERGRMIAALDQGLRERPTGQPSDHRGTLFKDLGVVQRPALITPVHVEKIPPALETQFAGLWRDDTTDATLIRLMARLGRPAAHARALALAVDDRIPGAQRVAMLGVLAEVGTPACRAPVLKLLEGNEPEAVQLAALGVLQRFDDTTITDTLLRLYPRLKPRFRARACDVLLSRKRSARAFLQAVDQGRIKASEVTVNQVRPVSLYRDKDLDALVGKHWGKVTGGTPEEKLAEMRRLSNDLRAGVGDSVHGHALFQRTCASCHRLFDEGNRIGPDLTHANRKDRDYLLVSIVDPSAVIRREYLSYVVHLRDGRVLTGLIVEQTAGSITLVNAMNQRTTVPREQVEVLEESPVSLMPENLLKDLKPQELRDLFSYLQK